MCLFVDIVEHHIEEELREVRLFIDVQQEWIKEEVNALIQ
ncbi:hypothetical protein HMPREF9406_0125 [Clostridium sp. HGF2]|nr:hypothetical protein HMPREF9406_0125 [Clostridium sp. HGF2]